MMHRNILYDSAETVSEKTFGFSVMAKNAVNQSDCRISESSISVEGITQYVRFFTWSLVITGR